MEFWSHNFTWTTPCRKKVDDDQGIFGIIQNLFKFRLKIFGKTKKIVFNLLFRWFRKTFFDKEKVCNWFKKNNILLKFGFQYSVSMFPRQQKITSPNLVKKLKRLSGWFYQLEKF